MMRTKFLLSTVFLGVVALFYPAVTHANLHDTIENKTLEVEETAQQQKATVQETIENREATIQENLQERRDKMKKRQREAADRIRKRQEDAKEGMKARKEAFQAKLQQIKDQRKRAIVERINNKLSVINQRATNRMSQALEKLSSHLDRFEQKTQDAKDKGYDTSTVDSAITDAKAAIQTAQSAVEKQAGNVYVLEIGAEDMLRSSVGQTVRTMKSDLRTTWGTVKDAKQAVVAVVRALAYVRSSATPDSAETAE